MIGPGPTAPTAAAEPWLDVADLYDHAPCACVTTLPDGRIVNVNRTFLVWTGYERDAVVGVKQFADLLPRGARAMYRSHHLPALERAGEISEDSTQIVCADGSRLPVMLSATMRYAADGSPALIHTAITDARVSREYEREVRAARDREREAREHAERLLADLARRGRQEAAVASLARFALGDAEPQAILAEAAAAVRQALTPTEVLVLAPGDPRLDTPAPADVTRHAIGDAAVPYRTLWVRSADGGPRVGDEAFLGTICSVAWLAIERRRLHDHDRHLAMHDPLTGLPNRLLLLDRLEHALLREARGGSRLAVLVLDLDGFKEINDTLGHHAGDAALRVVAARLVSCLRASDTVSRLGGDEFVVVCEDLPDEDHARETAERLRAAVAQPVLLEGAERRLEVSVGIALSDGDADPGTLLRQADESMYAVKQQRRADVPRPREVSLSGGRSRRSPPSPHR